MRLKAIGDTDLQHQLVARVLADKDMPLVALRGHQLPPLEALPRLPLLASFPRCLSSHSPPHSPLPSRTPSLLLNLNNDRTMCVRNIPQTGPPRPKKESLLKRLKKNVFHAVPDLKGRNAVAALAQKATGTHKNSIRRCNEEVSNGQCKHGTERGNTGWGQYKWRVSSSCLHWRHDEEMVYPK